MPRRRTPALEVADVLQRAARGLLDDGGPEALSVREIAARAGVAPMGVYKRFGSKNGILDALLIEGFDELADVIAPRYDQAPDPLRSAALGDGPEMAQLAAGMERYRTFALTSPSMYGLMFDRTVPMDCPSEAAQAAARNAFERLVTSVRLGIAAGEVERGDPTEIAQRLWAGCHGAVSLELRGMCFAPDTAVHYTALTRTLLRGVAATPPVRGTPPGE